MREVCVVDIAMSTRVALPIFMGVRMSELRRQLLPSPPPSQDSTAHVRKNLFGPIDHDENNKFVQDELSKISQADCKRWNFDFEADKPKEGRYDWEPVGEGVPQAYELPCLTAVAPSATHALPAPKPLRKPVPECATTTQHHQQQPSTSTNADTTPTTSQPRPPAAIQGTSTSTPTATPTPTTTTPTPTPTTPTTTTPKPTAIGKGEGKGCGEERRELRGKKCIAGPIKTTRHSTQTQVTDFLRICKSTKRPAPKLDDDPPPSHVKRPRGTDDPPPALVKPARDDPPPSLIKRPRTTS